jgi:hypothetical protein
MGRCVNYDNGYDGDDDIVNSLNVIAVEGRRQTFAMIYKWWKRVASPPAERAF